MVILRQVCYGEGNFEKILLKPRLGEDFQIGNAYPYTEKKSYSYLLHVDDIK